LAQQHNSVPDIIRDTAFCYEIQQQLLPQLLPQPFPQPPQPLLPQQHQTMISRMMIQQQLLPPKPLLHIQEPPKMF
jgi:hypothetical protein